MIRITNLSFIVVLLTCSGLLGSSAAVAQDDNEDSIHWAYAAFLGTGWYKLDENRQVYVLRVPPKWYFRDSSIDEAGNRQIGVEFHFPLTFGLHKLEQLEDFIDFDNIRTISFNPGIEIEYPISERWLLRAYGHLGWGTDTDSSDSALIYDGGVKSRYSFKREKLEWAIVNQLFFAGYNSNDTGKDGLTGIMAGLDFSYPLPSRADGGTPLQLNWDIGYRWYENNPSFPRFLKNADEPLPEPVTQSLKDEWQIGLAIAKQNGPFRVWFLNFQQLGLVYRFNSDGGFRAITLNFRAPFTR